MGHETLDPAGLWHRYDREAPHQIVDDSLSGVVVFLKSSRLQMREVIYLVSFVDA